MRVVGVIDIREGHAVHARGGRREAYAPIGVAACEPVGGDPVALARTYVHQRGVRELYVADLDAIGRGVSALNGDAIGRIAALGIPVFVDAGVATVSAARSVLDAGASTVVVGLETLTDLSTLADVCEGIGGARAAFSLDLRDGWPMAVPNADHAEWPVVALAERAALAGVGTIIVLDLARVGTGAGIDLALMADVRRVVPDVRLFAGGGVRDADDLKRLEGVGCDGVLVATALLTGAIRA